MDLGRALVTKGVSQLVLSCLFCRGPSRVVIQGYCCVYITEENRLCTAVACANEFSGRKIIKILEKNPNKDPSKYDEEDIPHMRKVVAYNKRHLAQESSAKQNPDSKVSLSLIGHSLATRCISS